MVAEGGRTSGVATGTGLTESILARIRANGGRVTGPRRVTVEVLAAGQGRHLGADDLAGEVRKRLPDVAPSTIYRTLAALEDLGVVTHVHLGHGPSTFHLVDHPHRHLVCRSCDTVIEIPDREFADLASRLESAYGFRVADEHFALAGDCRRCVALRH